MYNINNEFNSIIFDNLLIAYHYDISRRVYFYSYICVSYTFIYLSQL